MSLQYLVRYLVFFSLSLKTWEHCNFYCASNSDSSHSVAVVIFRPLLININWVSEINGSGVSSLS